MSKSSEMEALLVQVRACHACPDLPLGPRPVLQASSTARVLIAGQAPGIKVHQTGIPWNDLSGERLRAWLGVTREQFYDARTIAIVPMGFCYPGRLPNGGDAPPRRECAPLWRDRLLRLMPDIRLTLLVGQYAQVYALGPGALTERVHRYRDYLPTYFPLPHPSWRAVIFERSNPWFAEDVLPALRQAFAEAVTPVPARRSRRR